jgi:hypothetical protein
MPFGLGHLGVTKGGGSGPPAPPNTLVAKRGFFVLTIDTMTPAYAFGADEGAFALTGEAVTFSQGTVPVLSAAQGSFVLTGENVTLTGANNVAASEGAFTLTGEAITPGIGMSAAEGSFALTGEAVTLTAPATYTGPGDIYSFVAWYGLRAYNAAYATGTHPAIDLVDQSGANPLTVNITSSGNLDVTSIAAWVTAHSVTTIAVAKWYDQTGGGRHATVGAARPSLLLNAQGTLPLITGNGSQSLVTSVLTQAAPLTVSAVALRNSAGSGSHNFFLGDGTNSVGYGFQNVANTAEIYSSGVQNSLSGVADSTLHAIQMLATTSGGGTFISVDGTSSSAAGNISSGWSGTTIFILEAFGFRLNGSIGEVGIAAGNQTTSNATMRANQKTYWGTP